MSGLRTVARWLYIGLLFVMLTYCAVLVFIAFAAALTAPIWIWWCI